MAPWIEWKERCAIALCSPQTRETLQTFGGMRFRTFAQRGLASVNVTDVSALGVSDRDAWHLLETHMTLPNARNGKAYKQWLFDRTNGSADNPFDIIQGGASLLMRWAVREYLRREYLPADHISLEAPLTAGSDAGSALSIDDLLPGDLDPERSVEMRELQNMADQHAKTWFADLSDRIKLVLTARSRGIPLSSPALLSVAQCGKSVLSDAFRRFAADLFKRVQEHYPNDEHQTITELSMMIFESLSTLCRDWAEEKPRIDTNGRGI